MRIEWRVTALRSARRYLADQDGVRAINAAISALTEDPEPPEAFVRGEYRRLRVGDYRVELEANLSDSRYIVMELPDDLILASKWLAAGQTPS